MEPFFETATGRRLRRIETRSDSVTSECTALTGDPFLFDPTGKSIGFPVKKVELTGTDDDEHRELKETVEFHEFDIETGDRLRMSQAIPGMFARSPDGRTRLHANKSEVSLVETATGRTRWKTNLTIKPAPGLGIGGGGLGYWDGIHLLRVAVTADHKRAVVVLNREINTFALDSGKLIDVIPTVMADDYPDRVTADLSTDGRWIAWISFWGDLKLFDLHAPSKNALVYQRHMYPRRASHVSISTDGHQLVTSHLDGTCLVWDVSKLLNQGLRLDLVAAWNAIGDGDAKQAQAGIRTLVENPGVTVALVKANLRPAELQIESLLPEPVLLRQIRVVEVLERIGTSDAVAVLNKLATGSAKSRLTVEARDALERLKK